MTETLAHGYMVMLNYSAYILVLVLWKKVASALEGLKTVCVFAPNCKYIDTLVLSTTLNKSNNIHIFYSFFFSLF